MTAAPKEATRLKLSFWNEAKRRPVSNAGKAEVLWEETGKCTTEAAGVGVQARRKRFAEITSGRSLSQQRLTAICKDLLPRETIGYRRGWDWHMSPWSDEGGATSSDVARDAMTPEVTLWGVQRGSGHLAVPGVAGHRKAGEQWNDDGSKPV